MIFTVLMTTLGGGLLALVFYDVYATILRATNNAGALPLFRGIPSRETHNIRSEFATIFYF